VKKRKRKGILLSFLEGRMIGMEKKTVLCVDDSPTIRKLVHKALEPEGYEVVDAANGKEALDISDGRHIDFFLVDVNMPVMDGFQFAERLKNRDSGATVPVVFLTTESGSDKKQRGKELGVRGWIVKPFEATSLVKLVSMLTG
jgi:two-component system chemotaxis response regulator CheY